MCERLRDEFPECVDWLDRSAIVAEARGDLPAASDFYRRAGEFAAAQGGHDQELIDFWLGRADALAARVAGPEEAMS